MNRNEKEKYAEKLKKENYKMIQMEFDRCPLESEKAQNTFKRLGATQISEMKIDDDDKI